MSEELQFGRLDLAFSQFLGRYAALDARQLAAFKALVARLSYEQTQGHSCIAVDPAEQEMLRASGLASDAGNRPLVLEQNRLYLQRYWAYEQRLAERIRALSRVEFPVKPPASVLDRYFPAANETPDRQREAAKMAVQQGFSIITGGPGTGKTTTVVKILALLQEAAEPPLHIALAAPTGKAAMRLQEAIGFSKTALPCSESVRARIPETVTTLHRLLGARPPSPYFRHDAARPLPFDWVVVDEASMVDLALMSKLVDALKPGAGLILLGDKDQLASVEAGAVLADLTAALPGHSVELLQSHRFDASIKALAEAVNRQQPESAWEKLQDRDGNVGVLTDDLIDYVTRKQSDYLRLLKTGADFQTIVSAFNRFQVLCAIRLGDRSVADINVRVERKLAANRLLQPTGTWYAGRPVLVTQNDAALHLYNGDIGLCLPDPEQDGRLMVFFQRPDGSVKKYPPVRVPSCQTVFAMTIHKSQGSEFDEVLIVLPERHNPVLTKELLYTGITRARKTVRVSADATVFAETVRHKIQRFGGLAAKLGTGDD